MYLLADHEIDYILDDIRSRGVTLEDLQNNLLDHICCIIEEEMPETDDFRGFYERILPRFFKKELCELQEETDQLLTFKHYYAMKNTLNITGIASAVLTFSGAILKILHLPGAAICLILGGVLFCLFFLPLLIILKFKDEASITDKLVFSFGLLTGMASCAGVLFKIQHWPLANVLMISGLTSFLFMYVPMYFFTRIRRPELRFNTLVNSVLMLACGGMLFTLINLGYSKTVKDNIYTADDFLVASIHSTETANERLKPQSDLNEKQQAALAAGTEIRNLLQKSSVRLIAASENIPENEAADLSIKALRFPEAFDKMKLLYHSNEGALGRKALEAQLNHYNAFMTAAYPEDQSFQIDLMALRLEDNPIALLIHQFHQIDYQLVLNENRMLMANSKQVAMH